MTARSEHVSAHAPDALGVGRGLAIIFVMYGHALAPWVIDAGDHFSEAAFFQWKLGASFLMAFFFFLSGMAWRESTSLKAVLRQTIGLILIAWSASVFIETTRLVLTNVGLGAPFGHDAISPWQYIKSIARTAILGDHYTMATMWFLTALGLARLIAAITIRIGLWAVATAAVLLLAAGFAVTALGLRNIYQIAELGLAFVAFVGGRAARPLFQRMEASLSVALGVCVVAALVTLSTFSLNQGCPFDMSARCGSPWMNGNFSVTVAWGVYGFLPLFVLTTLSGIALLSSASIVLARLGPALGWRLAVWGRNTIALLVVNGAYLEFIHPVIARFVATNVRADSLPFFVALFAFTMAVNFAVAALMHRPLKAWLAAAMKLAALAVDGPRLARALSGQRRPRVSEMGE